MKLLRYILLFQLMMACLVVFYSCEGDKITEQPSTEIGKVGEHNATKRLDSLQTADSMRIADSVTAIRQLTEKIDTPKAIQQKTNVAIDDTTFDMDRIKEYLGSGYHAVDTVRNVDVIIIHSSYFLNSRDTFSVKGVISEYHHYHVSAHYLIDREGKIYNLVDENDVSYQAGESYLPADPSREHLNGNSIGIEVISTPTAAPTAAQYDALVNLVDDIRARRSIKYIYRHSDVSPGRKTDPWSFDWPYFLSRIDFKNPDPVPRKSISVNDEIDKKIGIDKTQKSTSEPISPNTMSPNPVN